MRHAAIAALAAIAAVAAGAGVAQERTPAPEDARVYFIGIEDGATVSNPVTLRFGLAGMGVAPSGVEVENTGHHHLLINRTAAEMDLSQPLPASDSLIHFGGGQTQVTTDLPPGEHTLQLVLGDWGHVPHDPPVVSGVLSITVR